MPSRLCNWIPGAHSKPPLSQDPNSVCFCVCHVECTTISLLRLLHVSRRKAWEWPLAHMAGHPLQEDLLALCPLTLGWWLYHLPAARGFSSLPLSMGRGRAAPPWLPIFLWKPKLSLDWALCISYACMRLGAEEIGKGRPLLVAVREAVERASVVRAHAEMPLSVSVSTLQTLQKLLSPG